MKKLVLATAALAAAAFVAVPMARADWVGAGAGAGTGLLVAGPIGALAGGGVGGRPRSLLDRRSLTSALPVTLVNRSLLRTTCERKRSGCNIRIASAHFGSAHFRSIKPRQTNQAAVAHRGR